MKNKVLALLLTPFFPIWAVVVLLIGFFRLIFVDAYEDILDYLEKRTNK